MTLIAVISDTHDRLPHGVVAALARADEIWHLGDVCDPETLAPLLAPGRPLSVVRGNCDGTWEWPARLRLERAGLRFHLEHIPPVRPPTATDIVLHGHTHVPRDETILGVRHLNPGCITRPNRGAPASFGWLHLGGDGALDWRLEPVR